MAEKRVKIGKDFEYVPAVKRGRGWLWLEKGKFGKVRFERRSQKLELWVKQGVSWTRTLFAVEDHEKANEAARRANKIGEETGVDFGALRKEETLALKIWRDYAMKMQANGTPARDFSEVVREAIEREETKDDTPLLADVVFRFIEAKDIQGGLSPAYRSRIKNRLTTFSRHFPNTRIGEITEQRTRDAILKLAQSRNGTPPAPKTQKHWCDLIKELFSWFYRRENASRKASEKLSNPLELLTAPKIEKTKEPEILTPKQAREFLFETWNTETNLAPIIAIQLFCGVRNAEALRLRWKDIKDGELHLSHTITKTKSGRSVRIPPICLKWLNAYRSARAISSAEILLYAAADTGAKELSTMTVDAQKKTNRG